MNPKCSNSFFRTVEEWKKNEGRGRGALREWEGKKTFRKGDARSVVLADKK